MPFLTTSFFNFLTCSVLFAVPFPVTVCEICPVSLGLIDLSVPFLGAFFSTCASSIGLVDLVLPFLATSFFNFLTCSGSSSELLLVQDLFTAFLVVPVSLLAFTLLTAFVVFFVTGCFFLPGVLSSCLVTVCSTHTST